jgi:hypothetical protein
LISRVLRTTAPLLLLALALGTPALMAGDGPTADTLGRAEPVKTASGKSVTTGNYSRAFFADLDGDGKVDMVTADVFGKLSIYKGTTPRGAPFADGEPLKLADGRPATMNNW